MRSPLDLVETGEGPSTLRTQIERDVGGLGNRTGRLVVTGLGLEPVSYLDKAIHACNCRFPKPGTQVRVLLGISLLFSQRANFYFPSAILYL